MLLPLTTAGAAGPRGSHHPIFGAQYAPLTRALTYGFSDSSFWSKYIRRGIHVTQWDLEYIFFQIINSVRSPEKLYKLTQHRKQTKNQWARDDPAFALLLAALLAASALAYGVAYQYTSLLAYAWLVAQTLFNFAFSGAVVSVSCWAIANKYMRSAVPMPHSVEQDVELLYCWDVHCNAYVSLLLGIHAGQFLLLPLIMRDGFVPALLGNTLYAASLAYYCYVTFEGYLGEGGVCACVGHGVRFARCLM
jgi:hypothetical protein